MDLAQFDKLATTFPGVRRRAAGSRLRWDYQGRLVARQLDETHVVVRAAFDVRDLLLRQSPNVFSVPNRFAKHMMVVADLDGGDDCAVEDAVSAAVRLQTSDS